MLKNITIGQYIPGDSMLHKSDPRIKIILALFLMVAILLINTKIGFLMIGLFTLLVIVTSNIPLRYTLKGMKGIMIFIMFASILSIFSISGRIIFEYKFIHITYEGINQAILTVLRLTMLIFSLSLLPLTTTPISLTDGIEKLMGPLKKLGLPVHEIALMMSIALRFIPTLLEEADKIMKAQAARGADFDTGNLVNRAKSFIPVLVPLFVSAFRRADELAVAMEARCYRGGEGRTRMKQLKLGRVDLAVSAITMVFITGVMYLQYR
jgi:energy-coupling factor transport system permease protein